MAITKPAIDSNNLDALGIVTLLGSGNSNYSGSSGGRATNVEVGARLLNGTLVPPGGEFSFNHAIGYITEENGYVEAQVIDGERIGKDIGGGICQVSTTVFRAAYYAGLPIDRVVAAPLPHRLLRVRRLAAGARRLDPATDRRPGDLGRLQVREPDRLAGCWSSRGPTASTSSSTSTAPTSASRSRRTGRATARSSRSLPDREIVDPELEPGTIVQTELAEEGVEVGHYREVYDRDGNLLWERNFYTKYYPRGNVWKVSPDMKGKSPADPDRELPTVEDEPTARSRSPSDAARPVAPAPPDRLPTLARRSGRDGEAVSAPPRVRLPGSLSLVLPAHNEEANLRPRRRARAGGPAGVRRRPSRSSSSTTAAATRPGAIADELAAADPRVRVVHHPRNRGYGGALTSGFRAATGDFVMFMDADRQFDIADLALLAPFVGAFDIVAGFRMERNDPFHRRVFAEIFNVAVRILFGVHLRDIDCAFKVFRGDLLRSLELTAPGALINTEIQAKARRQGATVEQVGVHHYPRRGRAGHRRQLARHRPRDAGDDRPLVADALLPAAGGPDRGRAGDAQRPPAAWAVPRWGHRGRGGRRRRARGAGRVWASG